MTFQPWWKDHGCRGTISDGKIMAKQVTTNNGRDHSKGGTISGGKDNFIGDDIWWKRSGHLKKSYNKTRNEKIQIKEGIWNWK